MIIFIEEPFDALHHEASKSLIKKLTKDAKDGAVISLKPEEMHLMKSAHIVGVGESNNAVSLIEIKDNHNYIAVCDESVNLSDFRKATLRIYEYSKISIAIVKCHR